MLLQLDGYVFYHKRVLMKCYFVNNPELILLSDVHCMLFKKEGKIIALNLTSKL